MRRHAEAGPRARRHAGALQPLPLRRRTGGQMVSHQICMEHAALTNCRLNAWLERAGLCFSQCVGLVIYTQLAGLRTRAQPNLSNANEVDAGRCYNCCGKYECNNTAPAYAATRGRQCWHVKLSSAWPGTPRRFSGPGATCRRARSRPPSHPAAAPRCARRTGIAHRRAPPSAFITTLCRRPSELSQPVEPASRRLTLTPPTRACLVCTVY